ncbi:unnamed protein product [Timema podura]|uniref:UBC core domain-containing protein n=1 Tax=Timema podura TaxID=61482 RepID=A0ABN7NMD7_TIMPD|nr:unnamed protein product [Timema podura]
MEKILILSYHDLESPLSFTCAAQMAERSLLDEPNPNSPANSLAAQLYQDNKREYEKRVATVVELSWLNFQETRIEDPPENDTTH